VLTKILVVDDDANVRRTVKAFLDEIGYTVCEASSVEMGIAAFRTEQPDAAILDYQLGDGTASDLLKPLRSIAPDVPLIVLTGRGSIDLAVRCMREGAENFLTKPVELATLAAVLERALESRRTRRVDQAGRLAQSGKVADPFVGTSKAVRELAAEAALAAASDSTVLIVGETGSGKGVLARWIHANGRRSQEAMVDLNCAGLSRELLESELFGHARGAFTGAVAEKKGLFEVAHRGTLFLDEIGDMDLQVQPKLLSALEDKRFRRLGDVEERRVDVRLVAATLQSLPERISSGQFRQDLYYRINTIVLRIPPLRERQRDIAELADALLASLGAEMGRKPLTLGSEALQALVDYSWPGNIRELRNVLERAILVCDGGEVRPEHLRLEAAGPAAVGALDRVGPVATLQEVERQHIEAVLRLEKGQVHLAAERLGVPRSSLYQRLKTFGLDPASYRS
jgi:DNA-binding NtrC family response regulator